MIVSRSRSKDDLEACFLNERGEDFFVLPVQRPNQRRDDERESASVSAKLRVDNWNSRSPSRLRNVEKNCSLQSPMLLNGRFDLLDDRCSIWDSCLDLNASEARKRTEVGQQP